MDSLDIMMFSRYSPFDPRAGGGEVVEWNTMLELAKRGHNINIVIGKNMRLPKVPNVTFHLIPSYSRRGIIDSASAIMYLGKSLNANNIDVIHGFHPEMVLTNLFHKIFRKPIIHEIHFPQLYPYTLEEILNYRNRPKAIRWALHLRCDKLAAICSERVVTPSNFMKNLIAKTYNLSEEKISIVPNGVDENILQIQRQNQRSNEFKLLFIGRLVQQKGIDILLKSLKKIVENNKNIKLNIVGEGNQRREYLQLAKDLKILDYIEFSGFLDGSEKIKYLIESDISIVPSRSESFGIVVAEGMAAGLPVVGSNVGGISELIEHDVTGVLVPPDNVQALTDAIIYLMENPDKRQSIGKAAKKFVENNFTWEKRVDKIEQIYTDIIQEYGSN